MNSYSSSCESLNQTKGSNLFHGVEGWAGWGWGFRTPQSLPLCLAPVLHGVQGRCGALHSWESLDYLDAVVGAQRRHATTNAVGGGDTIYSPVSCHNTNVMNKRESGGTSPSPSPRTISRIDNTIVRKQMSRGWGWFLRDSRFDTCCSCMNKLTIRQTLG